MSEQALNVDYAHAELRYNAFMLPAYRSALVPREGILPT